MIKPLLVVTACMYIFCGVEDTRGSKTLERFHLAQLTSTFVFC